MALERVNIVRYYEFGRNPTRYEITVSAMHSCGAVTAVTSWSYCIRTSSGEGCPKPLGNPEWTKQEKFGKHVKVRESNFNELRDRLREEALKYDTEDLFHQDPVPGHSLCPCLLGGAGVSSRLRRRPGTSYVEMEHPTAGTLMYPGHPYQLFQNSPAQQSGCSPPGAA